MTSQRTPYFRMAAALLALLGLFDAAYLALERALGNSAVFCPTGGGCTIVQESAYSVLLGVPVVYIGVLGYTTLLVVALISLSVESLAGVQLSALLLGLASLGVLFSFYLSYLQLFEIKAICFWCVVSALIELGIWMAALLDWRQARSVRRDGSEAGANALEMP